MTLKFSVQEFPEKHPITTKMIRLHKLFNLGKENKKKKKKKKHNKQILAKKYMPYHF